MPRLLLTLALGLVAAAGCGAQEPQREGAPATDTGAQPLPAVAEIVCDADGFRLLTPSVAPQPDGVHVLVQNETENQLAFSLEGESEGIGQSVEPGETTIVLPVPPGRVKVACSEGDPTGDGETLEIVDEDGLWVPRELEGCANVETMTLDYIADAVGEKGTPVEVVRRHLEPELEEGDVVEPAGYPEAESTVVRVVRQEQVVSVVDLLPASDGGWLVSMIHRCKDV